MTLVKMFAFRLDADGDGELAVDVGTTVVEIVVELESEALGELHSSDERSRLP